MCYIHKNLLCWAKLKLSVLINMKNIDLLFDNSNLIFHCEVIGVKVYFFKLCLHL